MNRLLLLLFSETIYSEDQAEFFETSIFKHSAYPVHQEMQSFSCYEELLTFEFEHMFAHYHGGASPTTRTAGLIGQAPVICSHRPGKHM